MHAEKNSPMTTECAQETFRFHRIPNRWLLAIALAFGLTHAWLSWGYIGAFWLDSGRWLHEVARFADGEVLYRDFVWPFPPVAMWVLGGIARLFGSDVNTIWTATSLVFVLLSVLYCFYVARIVEPSLRWLTLLAGLLLATAHANWGSAPLPTGMYTPAAPIGFLFIFAALLIRLNEPGPRRAASAVTPGSVSLGILCGLAILTKQDFWVPALVLVTWASLDVAPHPRTRRWPEVASVWAPFLAMVAGGIAVIGATAGWSRLAEIANGFGRVAEFGGRQFPSWERITIQVAGAALVGLVGLAALVLGGSLSLREVRRWAALFGALFVAAIFLHLRMSFQIAADSAAGMAVVPSETLGFVRAYAHGHPDSPLIRGVIVWLIVRLENNLFPAFLPAGTLIALLAFRRRIRDTRTWNTLLGLVLVCLAARLRRGFEHVEWFHLLLEIPVCIACLSLLLKENGRETRGGLQAALVALLLLGFYGHWRWGQDSLLCAGTYRCVNTPRGTICLQRGQAEQYVALQEALGRLDRSGHRPLLAFGYSGGYNYFLDRPNPTPLEEGFQFSGFPPEMALARLRSSSPAPLLLDTDHYESIRMPAPWLDLAHWELPTFLNIHARVDRVLFEKALEGCRSVDQIQQQNGPRFMLYDCDRAGAAI